MSWHGDALLHPVVDVLDLVEVMGHLLVLHFFIANPRC
jgi:hypothetical protein